MSKAVKVFFRLHPDAEGYPPASVESVWAQRFENGTCRIDNIPFFSRDATQGDLVTVQEAEDVLWFVKIVEPSANSLMRIVFFDLSQMERINQWCVQAGCETEYSAPHKLLAVSIPLKASLSEIRGRLDKEMNDGFIDYEEAIVRQSPEES